MPAPNRSPALRCAALAFWALIASGPATRAADYFVDQWTAEQGLPQNTILSITQTPDSYLWLATFNGLVRFDGVRFTVFNPVNTPELRSARILTAQVDRHGWLWIFSEEGHLTRMAGGKFEACNGRCGLPNGLVAPKGIDPDGNLWLSLLQTGTGFRLKGFGFVQGRLLESIPTEDLGRIRGGQDSVWLARGAEWGMVDAQVFRRKLETLGLKSASAFGAARGGGAWILGEGEIRRTGPGASRTLAPGRAPARANALVEDARGGLWITTWGNGLFVAPRQGLPERVPLPASGAVEYLRTLFIDHEENLWVGSDVTGLYRVKPRAFRNFDRASGLSGEVVKSVMEDAEGKIWVANQAGIDWIRPDGTVTNYLQHQALWTVSRGSEGKVWFGAYGGGVWRHQNGKLEPVRLEGGEAPSRAHVLAPDGERGMWLGAMNGLWHLQGSTMSRAPLPAGLPSSDVRAIVRDAKGGLCLAIHGAGLLRQEGGRWARYGKEQGLADDQVLCLEADTNGAVWIGTVCGGLSRFQDGRFVNYRDLAPAIPDLVSCILADDQDNFWLGGVNGIHRVARGELNALARGEKAPVFVHHYGKGDGLGTSECAYGMQPTAWKGRDGRLWFATINGVAMVDPKDLPFNPRPPPVAIDQVLVDDRPLRDAWSAPVSAGSDAAPAEPDPRRSQDPPRIILPAGNHRLEIRYTGLCFTGPEKVRFAYRLEGLDTDWTEAGARRIAYFQGLRPGPYEFRVIACNNDGVWNRTGAVLPFAVEPFVWQTWWFINAAAAALGGLLFAYFHARIKRLEQERARQQGFSRQLLESQENDRKRISAELHDGLGQNLLAIRNRALLGAKDPEISPRAKEQLDEISGISLHAIEEARNIAYALRPHQLDLVGLTQSIQALTRQVSAAGPVRIADDLDPVDGLFTPAEEINLYRIVQEGLNNIVKHSGASAARVALRREPGRMTILIEDDGRGFDAASVASRPPAPGGAGLTNLRERVKMLGGEWRLDSAPGRGTRVEIVLKVAANA